jgi:quinol monooxygenase YgiN
VSKVIVLAVINAKPGCEAALGEILGGLVEPTRLEAGCERYDLHRDLANPASLVFLETWADRDALQAHMSTPRFLAARARQEALVTGRDIRILQPV